METKFYYSTNQSIITVISLREERRKKLEELLKKWDKANEVVSQNWDKLFYNALLLEGQTEHLGFYIETQERDYYAPERVWITFNTRRGNISVEFHKHQKVKKICTPNGSVKVWEVKKLLRLKNEWAFVERALSILL